MKSFVSILPVGLFLLGCVTGQTLDDSTHAETNLPTKKSSTIGNNNEKPGAKVLNTHVRTYTNTSENVPRMCFSDLLENVEIVDMKIPIKNLLPSLSFIFDNAKTGFSVSVRRKIRGCVSKSSMNSSHVKNNSLIKKSSPIAYHEETCRMSLSKMSDDLILYNINRTKMAILKLKEYSDEQTNTMKKLAREEYIKNTSPSYAYEEFMSSVEKLAVEAKKLKPKKLPLLFDNFVGRFFSDPSKYNSLLEKYPKEFDKVIKSIQDGMSECTNTNFNDLMTYVDELAKETYEQIDDMTEKLAKCNDVPGDLLDWFACSIDVLVAVRKCEGSINSDFDTYASRVLQSLIGYTARAKYCQALLWDPYRAFVVKYKDLGISFPELYYR